MMTHSLTKIALITFCFSHTIVTQAQYPINYEASFIGNFGSGEFAPYYISSNNHGIITQDNGALLRLGAWRPMSTSTRFSYGFGVDFLTGVSDKTTYQRYDFNSGSFVGNKQGPAAIWLQQLYGEIKYRGVFLTIGLKEHESALVNNALSSGDLIESGNSRPMPETRIGFIDFQDIPFTNKWVQIQGEISYAKFTDNDWMRNHYNYYNYHINTGSWYNYKRLHFRTNPSKRFSFTIGMQAAGIFGGTTYTYSNGNLTRTVKYPSNLKQFFKMIIPVREREGLEGFHDGNHLGCWDIKARYRLKNESEIIFYYQSPWDDGSGIGKLNGFDGLWGLEYKNAEKSWINGAVIEYLDFTNQSGPIYWEPWDNTGTNINVNANGADNYYNNGFYNSYTNYGMSIGSPFLRSTIYNTDGYMAYTDNCVRGFHMGIMGNITNDIDYRVLFSYRKCWGTARIPRITPVNDTSMMVEAKYAVQSVDGLNLKAQLAFDRGDLYGNTFSVCITISYNGLFNIGDK